MRVSSLVMVFVGVFGVAPFAIADPLSEISSEDSVQVTQATSKARYDLKREMLLSEVQSLAQANANNESMLYQGRLAIVTVITGFLAYLFERSRGGRQKDANLLLPPSKMVVVGLMILFFCMYWSDCYILDIQSRVGQRVDEIVRTINSLPSMQAHEIVNVQNYPSLRRNDFLHKVAILFRPNFAQLLAYSPLSLMLFFLTYEAFKRK